MLGPCLLLHVVISYNWLVSENFPVFTSKCGGNSHGFKGNNDSVHCDLLLDTVSVPSTILGYDPESSSFLYFEQREYLLNVQQNLGKGSC